jgi:hypothetical protein
MKKQALVAVVVGVFTFALAGSLAWAADVTSVDIPFSFIVKDKELPAGRYEIRVQGEGEDYVAIQSTKGGKPVLALVIERLADTGGNESRVVFDKMADGKSYLSEVHIPGKDGFLVGIAKGRETHVTVTAKK